MSQGEMRKLLGDSYPYLSLRIFTNKEIDTFKASILQQFAPLTKAWNDQLHSEWTTRIYFAAKMIYSSTLLLNTLVFSKGKNIRVTEPYLLYYSLLNSCRALTFTLPSQPWNDGAILLDTHSKIINVASDTLRRLNKAVGDEFYHVLSLAKDYRELFSYRFPAKGVNDELFGKLHLHSIADNCRLLCEVAQLTSELMEQSYNKNCGAKTFAYNHDILAVCCSYVADGIASIDEDDAYRIAYILRKVTQPHNIYHTMSGGMTDDFFGAWHAKNNTSGIFNPDRRTVEIFELP